MTTLARRGAAALLSSIVSAWRALGEALRRRRLAARTRRELARLPDDTLRDLGLTRAEVGSVHAELHGVASPTRRWSTPLVRAWRECR